MPQWVIKSISNQKICTVKSVEKHGQLMNGRWLTVDIDSAVKLALSAGCYIEFEGIRYSIRSFADVEKSARQLSHGGAFSYKGLRLDDVSWQALEDTQMCDYVYGDNHLHYSGLGTFSFFASKASDVGYRVLANLRNKYGSSWYVRIDGKSITDNSFSEYDDYTFDEAKSISISSGTSVKEALDLLWSNWGVYYKVGYRTVDIITSDREPGIELKYGKDEGLKSIRRKINPNVEICTRVRAYGSERNMPYKWYNKKYNSVFGDAMYVPQLMLPHYAYIKSQNEIEFIDADGDLYDDTPPHYPYNLWATPNDIVLPSNNGIIEKYGSRDKEIHWNSDDMGEIFPSLKGMTAFQIPELRNVYNTDIPLDHLLSTAVNEDGTPITGTGNTSELTTGKINFKVRVPNPGFDPMAQKGQEDVVLLMQSGMCQSRGFVILKSEAVMENEQIVAYDLTCVKTVDDEIDQVFPNGNYTINGGEEYVYTGLTFNDESSLESSWLAVYIGAAEKRLLRAAALWLREHQTEQYVYEITPDNIYLQRQKDEDEDFDITEGDFITLSQDDLGHSEEVVETVVVRYGKEAIPTYEISFLRRDESESLGDRVKGLVGQTISVDSDIAKMNDAMYKKVNKTGFHTLFDPLDAQYNVLDINGDLTNLKYIRANFDFFSIKGVAALGTVSGGSGGGGGDLNALLASINDSSIGDTMPTSAQLNKCLVWTSNGWDWRTTGGGGGGTGTVTSVTAGTGLVTNPSSGITSTGSISIANSYLTRIDEGHQAYGWGNHANAGYLTQSSLSGYATKDWVTGKGYITSASLSGYLPLTGGTMTGQIQRSSNGLWVLGRDNAVIRQNGGSTNGWAPVFSLKTQNGSWEMGCITTSETANKLILTYNTDYDYNNNLNRWTHRIDFPQASGTLALASTTLSGYGISDAYIETTNGVTSVTLGDKKITPLTAATYNNEATLTSPYYVVTSGSISGNTLTLGRRTLASILNASGYTWWGRTMNGSGVVSGDMSSVGNIGMSGDLQMLSSNPAIRMGSGNNYKNIVDYNASTDTLLFGYGKATNTRIYGGTITLRNASEQNVAQTGSVTFGGSTKRGWYGENFIGVRGKFMLYYDDNAQCVMVAGPDGTSAVNFASFGGISALGATSGSGGLTELTLGKLKISRTGNSGGVLFQDSDGDCRIYSSDGSLYIKSDSDVTIDSELSLNYYNITNASTIYASLIEVGTAKMRSDYVYMNDWSRLYATTVNNRRTVYLQIKNSSTNNWDTRGTWY